MSVTKKLATTKLGVNVAKDFYNSFGTSDNTYYMYFAKHVPYGTPFEYLSEVEVVTFNAKDDVASSTISIPNIIFNNGDRVRYYTGAGITAMNGLVNDGIYYVINSTEDGFQLAATSSSTTPIAITGKSVSEVHYLKYASGRSVSQVTGDDVESPQDSEIYTSTQAYDDMLYAKRITDNDVRIMVPKHPWTAGTTYAQYDNTDPNLYQSQFFVVVDDITEYNVYKCLYNNGTTPSTVPPSRNGNISDTYPLILSDGYIWKYMYTITKLDYDRFNTANYIPVSPNTTIIEASIPGTVDVVNVSGAGAGYSNWYNGSLKSGDLKFGGIETQYALGDDASSIDDYYQNCVLKITSSQTPGVVGQYRIISGYSGFGARKYVTLESPFTISPSIGDTYEIYPLVYVWGDGSETETAKGRAIIHSVGNTVSRVEILSSGRNYRTAIATIEVPDVVKTGLTFKDATLNPIVSPTFGHGANPEVELGGRALGVSITVNKSENGTLPTTNDFRSIGIIKNPEFTNITISHDTPIGSFSIGEEVVQFKNIKLYGYVESLAGSTLIYKENDGKISNTISFAIGSDGGNLQGTGYDHRTNDQVIFDNTDTGGTGATATFIANLTAVKSANNFQSNNSVPVGSNFINVQSSHTFAVGDKVRYSVSTSTPNPPIYGLISGEYYYVAANTANSISVSTTLNGSVQAVSNYIEYVYNISSPTTSITGPDIGNKTLEYTLNAVAVLKNGTTLTNVSEYSQTNTSVITLVGTGSAIAGDVIKVRAYSNSAATSSFNVVNGQITSVTVTNQGSGYTKPPRAVINSDSGGSGAEITAVLANPEITSYADTFDPGDLVLITNGSRNFISTVNSTPDNYKIVTDRVAPFTTSNNQISKVEVTARGFVTSVATGQITITNVHGIFESGSRIAGLSSYATANIFTDNAIKINDKNPNLFKTAVQLSSLIGSAASNIPFVDDEKIYQDSAIEYTQPSARVHSTVIGAGANNDIVYASRLYGTFSREASNRTILGDTSGSSFDVLNVYPGDFVPGSGEVLYIENVDPINRNNSKSEQIKIILEF
jgi:hypothetical protein